MGRLSATSLNRPPCFTRRQHDAPLPHVRHSYPRSCESSARVISAVRQTCTLPPSSPTTQRNAPLQEFFERGAYQLWISLFIKGHEQRLPGQIPPPFK